MLAGQQAYGAGTGRSISTENFRFNGGEAVDLLVDGQAQAADCTPYPEPDMKPIISKAKRTDLKTLEDIFDGPIRSLSPVMDVCLKKAADMEYPFLDRDAFDSIQASNPMEAGRLYWQEILYRAHWAANSSLARSKSWFDGILNACVTQNYLAFCGCLRSLIEATGDSFPTMIKVAKTLALEFDVVRQQLKAQGTTIVINKELEDELIHYLFARKLTKKELKTVPESHQAKQSYKYIEPFKLINQTEALADMYSFLCQVVHPAAHSVHSFTRQEAVGSHYVVRLELSPDKTLIADFVADNRELLSRLAYLAVEPPLWVLRVLHKFDIGPEVKELRRFPSHLPNLRNQLTKALERQIKSYS